MWSAWEQRGRIPSLEDTEGYYDFLGEFAFSVLPALNAPAGLLPREITELLNVPASTDDLPLTVGMLLYVKRKYPSEYALLHQHRKERLLALSFWALQGLLSIGDPRLIPAFVSRFWTYRPMPNGVVTGFEYVGYRAGRHANSDISGDVGATNELEIRNAFHNGLATRHPEVLLLSGPEVRSSATCSRVEEIEIYDSAILVYRDQDAISGLSTAGQSVSLALAGSRLRMFDLHFSLRRQRLDEEAVRNQALQVNARRKLHILNLNPEYVPECYYSNLSRFGPVDYVIGQFAWEFSTISKAHEPGIGLMDEIWTGSRFETLLYENATDKPVVTMGLAIREKRSSVIFKSEQFGFCPGIYLFLCSFDGGSIVERKNPLGAITAFQRAFPRGTKHVGLIIKTRNLEHLQTERDRAHWADAMELIQGDDRVRVVQQTMSEEELTALYRMCGCFVSLHRSEGFGLGPAEAMMQGKAVIVTNYSGVCDFCTPDSAMLVPYELIRVKENEYPYLDPDRVYEWADPDLNLAAEYMRELAEDHGRGARLGESARAFLRREYSVQALRRRCLERFEQLGFGSSAS
jgi:hypothetical protein